MLRVENINGRMVVLSGIGKMFYQDGFPISMAIDECNKKGCQASILHIADELLKHGWSAKTTIAKLKGEVDLDISGEMKAIDWGIIEKFCYAEYETQREMIFNYLFADVDSAKSFLSSIITHAAA